MLLQSASLNRGLRCVVNHGKSADQTKAVLAEIEKKGGQALALQADGY
jgi:hypothetical protein